MDPELIRSMRDGDPMKLTGVPARKPQENDAIPKIAPKWLKHDKQVGTFEEMIREELTTFIIGASFQGILPGARC